MNLYDLSVLELNQDVVVGNIITAFKEEILKYILLLVD